MKYENYWNPGTVRGQQYRVRGRYRAFRLILGHPRIGSYLLHDVVPVIIAHVDANAHSPAGTAPDLGWHETTESDVRQAVSELPGVKPWPWLVGALAHFVVVLAAYLSPGKVGHILRQGRSAQEWSNSDEVRELLEDALGFEWADAQSQRHLTRAVELQPLNEHFLRAGRGVDVTHAMIDRWARDAHAAVEAAASEPVPRPTRKRTGDIDRWVGWWYRHDVLKETLATIVESDYGADRVKSNTGYVSQRVGIVRELLDEPITESSPS